MTTNVGLAFSVGDIILWFTIRIGDTKYEIKCTYHLPYGPAKGIVFLPPRPYRCLPTPWTHLNYMERKIKV